MNEHGAIDSIKYANFQSGITKKNSLNQLTVHQHIKNEGREPILKTIVAIIAHGIKPFKVKNTMDADDIVLFAVDFIEQYTHECFEDLILTFKTARMGGFGETFNRVDGPIIMGWFRSHLIEKYEAKEIQLQNEKHKPHEILELGPDRIKQLADSIQKKIEQNKTDCETWEQRLEVVKQQLPTMKRGEIKSLIKQMKQSNRYGGFNDAITYLENYIG